VEPGYGLDGPGSRKRFFSTSQRRDRLWGRTQFLPDGYGGVPSPWVKWPGPEVDHSSPSTAEVKNGAATLHSPICLNGVVRN
jgi:hypothetical protein